MKPLISIVDADPSIRKMGRQPVQRGLHELSDRELSEALSDLTIPAGEFVALFFAGVLLSLSFLLGPSTLVSATRGLVAATIATSSGAITQISTTMDRPLEAQASDYQPVQEPFGQAKAVETDNYHPSQRAQCPRSHPSKSEWSFFWNPVRGPSGDRCRLAKRAKARAVKIDAAGKDAQLAVSNVEAHR
jgi:hypothetical protein